MQDADEPVPDAYCFRAVLGPEATGRLRFDRHYLVYSAEGMMRIGLSDRAWLLPPAMAAWIPAGTEIEVDIRAPITTCSILFSSEFLAVPPAACRVFTVSPLLREMMLYAARWGRDAGRLNAEAQAFFHSLAFIARELAAAPSRLWVPVARSPAVKRALAVTDARLGEALGFEAVAKSVNMTGKTLARHLRQETGLRWSEILRRLRMIRAMEALAAADAQVLPVALSVGYESLSAFNRAFLAHAGETPSAFRRRCLAQRQDYGQGA